MPLNNPTTIVPGSLHIDILNFYYYAHDICTRNKGGNVKSRQILGENEMKLLRKIVDKTKIE